MTYEELLKKADNEQLITKEKNLPISDGRLKGNKIAINKNMSTTEKACTLAEELGHYHTTVGNILDQTNADNRKQEYRARMWGYNQMVGLSGIIQAYKKGCRSSHETAEYLNVTEKYLQEVLSCYKSKYGICTTIDNYIIYFEPCISVLELV